MADDGDYWEIPVLSSALLQPCMIVFRAMSGRVVIIPPPDDGGVIVPDAQVRMICAAARTALSVAHDQRRRLR